MEVNWPIQHGKPYHHLSPKETRPRDHADLGTILHDITHVIALPSMRLMKPKRSLPLHPDGLNSKAPRSALIGEINPDAQLPGQFSILAQLAHPRVEPLILELRLGRGIIGAKVPALKDPQHKLAVPQRQAAVESGTEALVDGGADEVVVEELVHVSRGRRA